MRFHLGIFTVMTTAWSTEWSLCTGVSVDIVSFTGNQLLVENKHDFWWFPHTFGHEKAHEKSQEELQTDMRKNRDFAEVG